MFDDGVVGDVMDGVVVLDGMGSDGNPPSTGLVVPSDPTTLVGVVAGCDFAVVDPAAVAVGLVSFPFPSSFLFSSSIRTNSGSSSPGNS